MTTGDVQKLREETGAGIMNCKKALEEAGGDLSKALGVIKAQGLAKAVKKSDRHASAGHLEAYIHQARVGVLLQVNAETDFVVKNDDFQTMAKDLVMHIAAMDPEDVDALMKQGFIKDPSSTIEEYIKGVIGKLGENINVIRFSRFEI